MSNPGDGYFVVRAADGERMQIQISDGCIWAIGTTDGLKFDDLSVGIPWTDFVTLHKDIDIEEKKG